MITQSVNPKIRTRWKMPPKLEPKIDRWRIKDDDDYIHIKVLGGYYDAGDHVKFGFPMAAMTVKALKIMCRITF